MNAPVSPVTDLNITSVDVASYADHNPLPILIDADRQPWFIVKDLTERLNLQGTATSYDVLKRVDDADQATLNIRQVQHELVDEDDRLPTLYHMGQTSRRVVNESGCWSIALSGQTDEARRFSRWVTSEVIPSIRRFGAYVATGEEVEFLRNSLGLSESAQPSEPITQERLTSLLDEKLSGLPQRNAELTSESVHDLAASMREMASSFAQTAENMMNRLATNSERLLREAHLAPQNTVSTQPATPEGNTAPATPNVETITIPADLNPSDGWQLGLYLLGHSATDDLSTILRSAIDGLYEFASISYRTRQRNKWTYWYQCLEAYSDFNRDDYRGGTSMITSIEESDDLERICQNTVWMYAHRAYNSPKYVFETA